jgi:hypothetical protein
MAFSIARIAGKLKLDSVQNLLQDALTDFLIRQGILNIQERRL